MGDKVEILKEKLKRAERNPVSIMNNIIEVFGNSRNFPNPGSYSTFIYNAKTPGLLYDRHPLIAVLELEEWGFKGFNFHLNKHRQYTWNEVGSMFCTIDGDEISYLRTIGYRVLIRND